MKKKILILSEWYLPGFKAGGPIQSLVNFVNAFSQIYDIHVFTRNTDAHDATPYPNIPPNTWLTNAQGIQVFYASADFLQKKNILSLIEAGNYDYLYINSMYSVPFSIIPLLFLDKNKYHFIVAVRGMLHRSALKIKPLKKKIFISLLKLSGIYKKVIWQATDDFEKTEVQLALGKNAPIKVAPNLPRQDQMPFLPISKQAGELKLVYISRIHHIKNLDFLLNLLVQAKGNISLDIFGPMEQPAYWEACQAIIQKLPKDKQVNYKGALLQSQISDTLQQYHVFCLPTLGENFGHAIFDALITGRPVLISDLTPWKDLEKLQIGWDISLKNEAKWVEILDKMADFSQTEYDIWAKTAYQYATHYLQNPALRKQVMTLFH